MSEPYWVPLGAAPATPAPAGITKLFDITLGSAAPSIDIPNIAQTYTHLKIIAMLRGDTAATLAELHARFNGDASALYDSNRGYMQTTTWAASVVTAQTAMQFLYTPAGTSPTGAFGMYEFTCPNYTSAAMQKNLTGFAHFSHAAATPNWALMNGSWRTYTAPVTSILLYPNTGNWAAGCRVTMYGLI